MLSATSYQHIVIDENGVPMIEGTTMKVVELVLDKIAYGWSPEELFFQHPYLTLGQIYSALAYYADHTEAIDQDIEHGLQEANQLWEANRNSPLRARLKAQGLL